jgi:predicted RNase H-like HicB family nuclease
MSELIFNVTQEEDGGYVAVAVGESIVTQGDTWEELCYMVTDATKGYFYDLTPPQQIRLFLHREQLLAVA